MGSKARESAKAMTLACILLDFQHAGVRRRAYSVETECRHVAVQRDKQDQRDTNVKVVNLWALRSGAV